MTAHPLSSHSSRSSHTTDSSEARPAGSRRLRKTERTRLRLVDAVRGEIEHGGGFTAEAAARRAETSPATFYNHFATKDDALAAAFDAVMDDLVAHVATHLDSERLVDRGLDAFATDWVRACAAFFRANCMTLRAAQARVPVDDGLRRIFRAHEDAALALYVRFVEGGQAAGVLRGGDATAIAHALMIQNEGWNHPAVLRLDADAALHGELARAFARHLSPHTPDLPRAEGARS